jgi:hypothetical protein
MRRSKRRGEAESRGLTVVREKAKLSNADEAARRHVLHSAPEQLHGGEGHRPTLTVAREVRPAKGDPLGIKGDYPVIAGRDV